MNSFDLPYDLSPTKVILNLGEIEYKNERFHTKQYIWPVGFKSKVLHVSHVNPKEKCWYITEIQRKVPGGDLNFVLTCLQYPGFKEEGPSASSVWKKLLEKSRANAKKKEAKKDNSLPKLSTSFNEVKSSNSGVSGTDKMGIKDVRVKRAIEMLPNSHKCAKYQFKHSMRHKQQRTIKDMWPSMITSSKTDKYKLMFLKSPRPVPCRGRFRHYTWEMLSDPNKAMTKHQPRWIGRKKEAVPTTMIHHRPSPKTFPRQPRKQSPHIEAYSPRTIGQTLAASHAPVHNPRIMKYGYAHPSIPPPYQYAQVPHHGYHNFHTKSIGLRGNEELYQTYKENDRQEYLKRTATDVSQRKKVNHAKRREHVETFPSKSHLQSSLT